MLSAASSEGDSTAAQDAPVPIVRQPSARERIILVGNRHPAIILTWPSNLQPLAVAIHRNTAYDDVHPKDRHYCGELFHVV